MMESWKPTALSELLKPVSRAEDVEPIKEYRLVGVRLDGGGPFLRETRLGSELSAKQLYQIKAGDFIYSRLFAWRGAFGIIHGDLDGCYVSGEFPTFTPIADKVEAEFLRLWFRLSTTLAKVEADCTGSTPLTRNRFKEHFFLALRIPLPPLPEQQRIVARIEELAALIEEARALRAQAREEAGAVWSSVLARVFAPLEHKRMTIENACDEIIDNLHSTPVYDGNEFLTIRSQDVGWGTIDYTSARKTSREEFVHRTRRGEPRAGDVVYVREGDVGRCALVDESQRFSLGQRVMMFRPNQRLIDSKFFMFQLLSPPVHRQQVLEGMKGTTSHHVNIRHLKRVKINVPNLPEQHRIVAHLDALQAQVDELKALQDATQAELDALLPSVLHRAFRGEL